MTIVMLGCDNAGKTSLVAKLSGQKLKPGGPAPTNGFANVQARHGGAELTLFDVGGGPGIRGIWPNYFADAHAAVFVVDAAAPERFAEAATLLREAWSHHMLHGKPLLVLANKQDRSQACSGSEVADALRLHELDGSNFAVCNVGAGSLAADGAATEAAAEVEHAIGWLLGRVKGEYAALSERVAKEVAEQLEMEKAAKEARKARLAAKRAAREAKEREDEAAAAAVVAGGLQPSAEAAAPTAGVDVGLPTGAA